MISWRWLLVHLAVTFVITTLALPRADLLPRLLFTLLFGVPLVLMQVALKVGRQE
jgi:hypothetical protein